MSYMQLSLPHYNFYHLNAANKACLSSRRISAGEFPSTCVIKFCSRKVWGIHSRESKGGGRILHVLALLLLLFIFLSIFHFTFYTICVFLHQNI